MTRVYHCKVKIERIIFPLKFSIHILSIHIWSRLLILEGKPVFVIFPSSFQSGPINKIFSIFMSLVRLRLKIILCETYSCRLRNFENDLIDSLHNAVLSSRRAYLSSPFKGLSSEICDNERYVHRNSLWYASLTVYRHSDLRYWFIYRPTYLIYLSKNITLLDEFTNC